MLKAPLDELLPILKKYYNMGMTDVAVISWALKDIDTRRYGLRLISLCDRHEMSKLTHAYATSLRTYQRYKKKWGMAGTRQQAHTAESIHEPAALLRRTWPSAGVQDMKKLLLKECGIKVSRCANLLLLLILLSIF